nr:MAG TPA: hypothetical protein [Caudoviricetes sp.]
MCNISFKCININACVIYIILLFNTFFNNIY